MKDNNLRKKIVWFWKKCIFVCWKLLFFFFVQKKEKIKLKIKYFRIFRWKNYLGYSRINIFKSGNPFYGLQKNIYTLKLYLKIEIWESFIIQIIHKHKISDNCCCFRYQLSFFCDYRRKFQEISYQYFLYLYLLLWFPMNFTIDSLNWAVGWIQFNKSAWNALTTILVELPTLMSFMIRIAIYDFVLVLKLFWNFETLKV